MATILDQSTHWPTFDEADRISREALELATKYKTPPVPRAYEVWFTYASKSNTEVVERIDSAVGQGREVEAGMIAEIYEEHFAQKGLDEGVAAIGERMDDEIADIVGQIKSNLVRNAAFAGALSRSRGEMTAFSKAKDVKRVADELVAASSAHSELVEAFGSRLTHARDQISAMQRELDDLRERAFHDHLTGLLNRGRFDEKLNEAIAHAQATGEPLCVALADIDKFKRVNDTWGHAAGDSILKKFAQVLKQNVKGKDIAARYGGEEFALILTGAGSRGARQVAEQVRQAMRANWFVTQGGKEPVGRVTVSIGVAEFRPDDVAASVLARADALLYQAKDGGRDAVRAEGAA